MKVNRQRLSVGSFFYTIETCIHKTGSGNLPGRKEEKQVKSDATKVAMSNALKGLLKKKETQQNHDQRHRF